VVVPSYTYEGVVQVYRSTGYRGTVVRPGYRGTDMVQCYWRTTGQLEDRRSSEVEV
jgi:hypothetical protein